jgi:hypothetical protein
MLATRDGRGNETCRLLQLLAHRDGGGLEWLPTATWDWRTFAETCDAHQLAPYVYCRLQGLTTIAVPPELLEHLRARFHEVCARNYQLAKKLVDLTSMLENEGVPVLAFKGPSLAMAVYGGLSLRQCEDLDLVIHKEDLEKAVHLMTGWGFRAIPTPDRPQITPYRCRPENPRDVARGQEIPFCAPDSSYYVDVHWQLGDIYWRSLSPDVEKLWERAERQDLPEGSVTTLCREDLFLALCAHGTRHGWLYLKWLVDIAELLRKAGTLDWTRIEEIIRVRPGAGAAASVAVILAGDLLQAPIPAEAGKILPATSRTLAVAAGLREELLLRGQTSGEKPATLLALEARRVARMKYRAVRIIRYPGSLFMEIIVRVSPKDRALIGLSPRLQFLYHIIRPVRLVVKHGMRVARTLWSTAG